MKVKKLSHHARLPQKAHAGDLGYDLFAAEYATIHEGETKLISTGIAIQLPEGYGAIIRDRSSVATKRNLFVVAGVIDNGYTGEIKVAFHSTSDKFEQIHEGDKIAQLILIPTVDFAVEEVSELESLDGRGEKGFGSTGT
jgi:dUTP pyrophosphatase